MQSVNSSVAYPLDTNCKTTKECAGNGMRGSQGTRLIGMAWASAWSWWAYDHQEASSAKENMILSLEGSKYYLDFNKGTRLFSVKALYF